MGNIHSGFKTLRLIVVKSDGFIRTKVIKCADSKMQKQWLKKKKKSNVKFPEHLPVRWNKVDFAGESSGAPEHLGGVFRQAERQKFVPAQGNHFLLPRLKMRASHLRTELQKPSTSFRAGVTFDNTATQAKALFFNILVLMSGLLP